MAFVLDCSATMPWLLHDDPSGKAQEALLKLKTEQAVVPDIWALEVANVLLNSERKGLITTDKSEKFTQFLDDLSIHVAESNPMALSNIMDLGRQHRLSSYDAAYLELALRENMPLATLDKALQQAAKNSKVALL